MLKYLFPNHSTMFWLRLENTTIALLVILLKTQVFTGDLCTNFSSEWVYSLFRICRIDSLIVFVLLITLISQSERNAPDSLPTGC